MVRFLFGAFLVWNFIAALVCRARIRQPGGGTIGLSQWARCARIADNTLVPTVA
jgi:hypothetical protein